LNRLLAGASGSRARYFYERARRRRPCRAQGEIRAWRGRREGQKETTMFIAANQVPECNCVVVGGTEEEVVGKMRAFLAERGIERDCRSFFVGRLSEDGTIVLSEDGTIVTCVKDLPPGACRGEPSTGLIRQYS
jgi:hypothetical protein